MFYQTVLQWVGNGGAIDVQGKRLGFIGYMQVQAGDSVWTDGRIIFGNVPPKSTPNIITPNNGIPILCKTADDTDFVGYSTRQGNKKKKNIISDDWIVNDKKNFEHGSEFISGQKVIETDIFENKDEKNLYVITEGFYRKNQSVNYHNHLYIVYNSIGNDYVGNQPYAVIYDRQAYQGEEITLGSKSDNINQPIRIYKNNELIEEIDLKSYADYIAEKSLTAEKKIMLLSQNNGANYTKQPAPPESFIASEYARPISFRINQSGAWDAIIFASACGYCFPYALLDGSVFEPIFNKENGSVKTFSEALVNCLANLERAIFTNKYFPFLNIEKYPKFEGNKKNNNGDYTPAYQDYVESAIEYYIPLVRFKYSFWFPVNFGASCLLRVHNGEIISVMKLHYGGGNVVRSAYEWNETKGEYYVRHNFFISQEFEENEWNFPVDTGFSCSGTGNQITAIYDSEQNKIVDLAALDFNIGEYFEVVYDLQSYYDHKDTQCEILAQTLNIDIRAFTNSYIELPSSQYRVSNKSGINYAVSTINTVKNELQPNADYEANEKIFNEYCKNLQNKEEYFLMDGFFDSESDDGFFRFNPTICKANDKNYLFGVHGGGLFFINENENKKIGNKIKNFRLKEMKNLNKAKAKNE